MNDYFISVLSVVKGYIDPLSITTRGHEILGEFET